MCVLGDFGGVSHPLSAQNLVLIIFQKEKKKVRVSDLRGKGGRSHKHSTLNALGAFG